MVSNRCGGPVKESSGRYLNDGRAAMTGDRYSEVRFRDLVVPIRIPRCGGGRRDGSKSFVG